MIGFIVCMLNTTALNVLCVFIVNTSVFVIINTDVAVVALFPLLIVNTVYMIFHVKIINIIGWFIMEKNIKFECVYLKYSLERRENRCSLSACPAHCDTCVLFGDCDYCIHQIFHGEYCSRCSSRVDE